MSLQRGWGCVPLSPHPQGEQEHVITRGLGQQPVLLRCASPLCVPPLSRTPLCENSTGIQGGGGTTTRAYYDKGDSPATGGAGEPPALTEVGQGKGEEGIPLPQVGQGNHLP